MIVDRFKVENFKSWSDSDWLTLDSSMNVFIGQNNSGKSALLEALSIQGGSRPHKSIETLPSIRSTLNLPSKVTLCLKFNANELSESVSLLQHNFFIPSAQADPRMIEKEFIEWTQKPQTITAVFENNSLALSDVDGFGQYSPGAYFFVDPNTRKLSIVNQPQSLQDHRHLFFYQVVEALRDRIYFFHAERYNVGHSNFGINKVLNPKAENLGQVLSRLLLSDKKKFADYVGYVSSVLPQVIDIIIPPTSSNQSEIRIWTSDPIPGRDDLAIPLSESGTGIGQILAMLYVITTSEYPQCILIDEPQSFLHPGAVRSLMRVFEEFDQHQYVLSTHSPALLRSKCRVISVSTNGVKSNAEVIPAASATEMRLILENVGARLSDVFGADRILWVEGLTEERCYKLIQEHFHHGAHWQTEIVGVRTTGELEGKHAETIYDVYSTLSGGAYLIPPAVGFIFDRELRTEQQCLDLVRKSSGKVHFTKRRMFENYLLNCDAISKAMVVGFKEIVDVKDHTSADIRKWIEMNGSKFVGPADVHLRVLEDDWLMKVDGARLLSALFKDFSNNRYQYDKVKTGLRLTGEILKSAPADLEELGQLISKVATKS